MGGAASESEFGGRFLVISPRALRVAVHAENCRMKLIIVYTLLAPVAARFSDDRATPPLPTIPLMLNEGCSWETAVRGIPTTTAVRFAILAPPRSYPNVDASLSSARRISGNVEAMRS